MITKKKVEIDCQEDELQRRLRDRQNRSFQKSFSMSKSKYKDNKGHKRKDSEGQELVTNFNVLGELNEVNSNSNMNSNIHITAEQINTNTNI